MLFFVVVLFCFAFGEAFLRKNRKGSIDKIFVLLLDRLSKHCVFMFQIIVIKKIYLNTTSWKILPNRCMIKPLI